MKLERRLAGIKHWLTLKSSGVPFIVGYALPAWTSQVARRYPDYLIIEMCALYARRAGSETTFAVDEDRYRAVARDLFADPADLARNYQDFCRDEEKFWAVVNALERDPEWVRQFAELRRAYVNVYCAGILIDGFLVYGDEFVGSMRAAYPDAQQEIETLIRPAGLHFMQREKLGLLTLALANERQRLPSHRAAWHWIHNNYKEARGLPESYFEEHFEQLLRQDRGQLRRELNELETYEERQRQACEAIQRRHILAAVDFERSRWLGKIAWWMDRRKACNLVANHYIDRYAQHIAGRVGAMREEVLFLLPWEAEDVLAGKKEIAGIPIKGRMAEMGLIYTSEDEWEVLLGAAAQQLRTIIDPVVVTAAESLQGVCASPGRARGVVRVVFDPHVASDFRPGDVLVTPMTRPDFVPLMMQASAIVTDEGGITSHAAIISRELGKPCVIGTKMATKVFKDGDEVEVDAQAGRVRVVRRAGG